MLKKLRKQKGMKQEWIAAKIGISSNYVSMLESGIRRWRGEIIKKYKDALK